MNGRMDMAVLYGSKSVHGLSFTPLLMEELFLVSPVEMELPEHQIALAQLQEVELLLPRPYNVMRKLVDEAFMAIHRVPHVVAEIESATTLVAAIAHGLGATILPGSAARVVGAACNARLSRIIDPVIEAPLALCTSDHLPMSEPAVVVRDILMELVGDLAAASLPGRDAPS